MTKRDDHRAALRNVDDWLPYLIEHSGLPGPRGNLELVAACGDEADLARAAQLVATGDEFATMCGIVAFGRHFGTGDDDHLALLHRFAADDRWRVREGVAMALQRASDDNLDRGFRLAEEWAADLDRLVKRAAVAAVCEPRLLRDKAYARRALALLDRVTDDLGQIPTAERSDPAVRTLRRRSGTPEALPSRLTRPPGSRCSDGSKRCRTGTSPGSFGKPEEGSIYPRRCSDAGLPG